MAEEILLLPQSSKLSVEDLENPSEWSTQLEELTTKVLVGRGCVAAAASVAGLPLLLEEVRWRGTQRSSKDGFFTALKNSHTFCTVTHMGLYMNCTLVM